MLNRKQIDFLYWHAVSKMRTSDFQASGVFFQIIKKNEQNTSHAEIGYIYSLIRQEKLDQAYQAISELRRRALSLDEILMLGRMQRRCERDKTLNRRKFTGGPAVQFKKSNS